MQGHFQQIDTDINSGCHSKDSLLQFEKQILAAKSLLDATSNKKPLHTLPVAKIPGNKRIEPQLRFFSTKKRNESTPIIYGSPSQAMTISRRSLEQNEFMPKVKVAGTQKVRLTKRSLV